MDPTYDIENRYVQVICHVPVQNLSLIGVVGLAVELAEDVEIDRAYVYRLVAGVGRAADP